MTKAMISPVNFIKELSYQDLSDDLISLGKRALIDTLGVAVAGSTTQLSHIIHNHVVSQFAAGSDGTASLFQDGRKVSAAGAALANGMSIDSVDGHDGHKLVKGHIGCGVVPSIFAMAEATQQMNFGKLLAATVVGYEIGTRAGISLHATAMDYHTSGAWVALATAAVSARYLKLDDDQIRHAIGIAEYHGPRSQMMRTIDHPSMVKDGSGWGAMAGVSAAYLARDGFTGAPAISAEGVDVADIWSDLGEKWYVGEQYIKLYPVCRWAQPPVEAALALKKAHAFSIHEISSIKVTTFHEAKRLTTRHPATTEEAQYSLPYSVAAALVHNKIGVAEIDGAALDDPDTRRIRDLIEIDETKAYNNAFPQKRIASVSITLLNGDTFSSEPTEARGDPENPVDDDVIAGKFSEFCNPVIGAQRANDILDIISNHEAHESVGELIELLASPA